ncbi:glycosyltransferase family protein 64 C3 [Magnolia sinica]|uniref:glycosyltransferase family protein 64 C3 n=1 Tax=Magnolia sinica TaxID=86752 RepID=UPI00265B11CC|nr:glycosyltransferase family protein 64 C3 [Magnolia sinica]
MPKLHLLFFFFFFQTPTASVCNPKNRPKPHTLRHDQLTILISGFSESRLPLLYSLASSYASSPSVAAVLILWCNPQTLSQTLNQSIPLSVPGAAPISIHRSSSSSLNARFFPRRSIPTRAVAVCDDDVEIDPSSLDFSFRIWRSQPDRLVGFFARSHDFDLARRTWMYTVHPDKFSIVLTKFMILDVDYLWKYSCGDDGGKMEAARQVVDEMRNCEDILMNFVVAEQTGVGPILVGGKKVRDWGDTRNEGEETLREVGLSTREGHRKMRGDCIREFHKVFEKMPLKYSYGKMVGEVGEQGLCEKGGKLVFCDEQVGE